MDGRVEFAERRAGQRKVARRGMVAGDAFQQETASVAAEVAGQADDVEVRLFGAAGRAEKPEVRLGPGAGLLVRIAFAEGGSGRLGSLLGGGSVTAAHRDLRQGLVPRSSGESAARWTTGV